MNGAERVNVVLNLFAVNPFLVSVTIFKPPENNRKTKKVSAVFRVYKMGILEML